MDLEKELKKININIDRKGYQILLGPPSGYVKVVSKGEIPNDKTLIFALAEEVQKLRSFIQERDKQEKQTMAEIKQVLCGIYADEEGLF